MTPLAIGLLMVLAALLITIGGCMFIFAAGAVAEQVLVKVALAREVARGLGS